MQLSSTDSDYRGSTTDDSVCDDEKFQPHLVNVILYRLGSLDVVVSKYTVTENRLSMRGDGKLDELNLTNKMILAQLNVNSLA